jgi:hypothetical protein
MRGASAAELGTGEGVKAPWIVQDVPRTGVGQSQHRVRMRRIHPLAVGDEHRRGEVSEKV